MPSIDVIIFGRDTEEDVINDAIFAGKRIDVDWAFSTDCDKVSDKWAIFTNGALVKFSSKEVGIMDSDLFKEWFQAFSQAAGITLHVENIYGDNSHHIIESCFKGLARSLREALEIDKRIKNKVPSTKGVL